MHISPTCQSIRDKTISFPPKQPGYYDFPSCMLDKAGLQIQHEWNHTVITNLMSALPHFDVAPKLEDPSTLPWRVLWPYHPVIETFGQGKTRLPDDGPFFYPDDLNSTLQEILPSALDGMRDCIVVEPIKRVVIYHRAAPARHKCAVFLAARMDGDIAPYFRTLWDRDENTPLPSTDPGLQTTISARLQTAHEVLMGHARPMHKSGWTIKRRISSRLLISRARWLLLVPPLLH